MYFNNDPRPGDKQPIMAEEDEYVVNRNAARKHKNLLDFINYVDEPRFDNKETAHSAIDEAMALNTLSGIGMQEGGEIALPGIPGEYVSKKSNKGQNPMSLGLVSNWLSKAFSRDGELSPNYGEFNRLLINEPEPRDRLTPEEGVLKELLGMQNGGPVEDKRNRKTMQSIGVKDELAESMDYFKYIDDILKSSRGRSEYSFSEPERGGLESLKEQGVIDIEEALKHLDHIQRRYQEGTVGFHSPRYQTGGNVSYGEESIERPTVDDIFSSAGEQPNSEQMRSFMASYGTLGDDSFIGSRGDYASNMQNITSEGVSTLSKTMSDTSGMGVGFSGMGLKKAIQEEVRDEAEKGVHLSKDDAKRGLFEEERAINEDYLMNGLNEINRLAGLDGTIPYPAPASGGDIFFGESGTGYMNTGFGGGFATELDNTTTGPETSPLVSPGSYEGETIDYNGETYTWDGSSWQLQTSGATGGTGLSDRRLKKDINHLFTMDNGVPIYSFKYNWSNDIELGTMAQDIEGFMPEAVSELNGYKLVDYNKVFK